LLDDLPPKFRNRLACFVNRVAKLLDSKLKNPGLIVCHAKLLATIEIDHRFDNLVHSAIWAALVSPSPVKPPEFSISNGDDYAVVIVAEIYTQIVLD
jgi:hypothetical protein